MTSEVNHVSIAAETAAATESVLLLVKQSIRTDESISEVKRDIICRLMTDLFQLGFTKGSSYMAQQFIDVGKK